MYAVVDYGAGNLRSIQKAVEYIGKDAAITSDPAVLDKAEVIILPGVGAADTTMQYLKSRQMDEAIKKNISLGKPFLGICLGMQLLFDSSDEGINGPVEGLGILRGQVSKMRSDVTLPIPHMGWNQVKITSASELFEEIETNSYFYFVHSYYSVPEASEIVTGSTEYSETFCSAIQSGNIMGTQFHPEKSGKVGLQMLVNFSRWAEKC